MVEDDRLTEDLSHLHNDSYDSSGNPCYDEDLGSFPRSQLQKKFL